MACNVLACRSIIVFGDRYFCVWSSERPTRSGCRRPRRRHGRRRRLRGHLSPQ